LVFGVKKNLATMRGLDALESSWFFRTCYVTKIWENPVSTYLGANPTTATYNAVKNYTAMRSVVRFEKTNIFFYFQKTLAL
jgi:hypothetical protein